MPLRMVNTDKAPKAIGPYSQAVRAGDLLFCSGQIPLDPATGKLELFEGDPAKQARLVMQNLKAVLEAEGLAFDDVVKTTIFLSSMEHFAAVNEVYASYFGDYKPARACVEVARLPKDVSVEIEAIAWEG
jgi:2-iminobutanoate/2-iminopropanoate deaminase